MEREREQYEWKIIDSCIQKMNATANEIERMLWKEEADRRIANLDRHINGRCIR